MGVLRRARSTNSRPSASNGQFMNSTLMTVAAGDLGEADLAMGELRRADVVPVLHRRSAVHRGLVAGKQAVVDAAVAGRRGGRAAAPARRRGAGLQVGELLQALFLQARALVARPRAARVISCVARAGAAGARPAAGARCPRSGRPAPGAGAPPVPRASCSACSCASREIAFLVDGVGPVERRLRLGLRRRLAGLRRAARDRLRRRRDRFLRAALPAPSRWPRRAPARRSALETCSVAWIGSPAADTSRDRQQPVDAEPDQADQQAQWQRQREDEGAELVGERFHRGSARLGRLAQQADLVDAGGLHSRSSPAYTAP